MYACGLFAEFHGARIATNNLHRSSPNSDCMAGVHDNLGSSKTLDVRLRFSGAGSEVLNSRGLGSGDGVAEVDGPPGHVDTGGCNECDQLAECERLGCWDDWRGQQ